MPRIQLTHTGQQLDEAIGKVLANYANVSEVTAGVADVRAGKKFVDAQKVVRTGTMPDATVTPRVSIQSNVLKTQVTEYEIVITPQASLSAAGYVAQIETTDPVVRYIKAASVTVVAGETDQTIEPAEGAFFDAVIVKAAQQPQLHAPTITQQSGVITIYDNAQNGTFVQYFDLYADDVKIAETTRYNRTFDLSTVLTEAGVYTLSVKARAEKFIDSGESNTVAYAKYGKLPTPEFVITEDGHTLGGGTLTIIAVDNASGYTLQATTDENTVYTKGVQNNALTVDLDDWLASGTYAIRARTDGAGVYQNSDFSAYQVYSSVASMAITIDGVTYYAKTGETWFTFATARDDFSIDQYGRIIKDGEKMVVGFDDLPVDKEDVISSSVQYTLVDI